MKKIYILLLLLNVHSAFAQQILSDVPRSKKILQDNEVSQQKRSRVSAGSFFSSYSSTDYVYFYDTLGLKFIDDFFDNRVKKYDYPSPPFILSTILGNKTFLYESGVCKTLNVTLEFMRDKSWNYTYDVLLKKVDSLPKTPFFINIYDSLTDCSKKTDSMAVWPAYYRFQFDTSGNRIDSFFISPDDTMNVVFKDSIFLDTIFHVKDDPRSIWTDNYVYVNNYMGMNPITMGVATFDGIDEDGHPYNSKPNSFGSADRLTSKPINMLTRIFADSIKLSFFWEPQGWGEKPTVSADSFILEFKDKSDNWNLMWSKQGSSSLQTDTFQQVVITVKDSVNYYYNGFQFRFRNEGTIAGIFDHWHLDYVRVDTGDHYTINDVAFLQPASSLLKNYQAMPWKQYRVDTANEIAVNHYIYLKNNSLGQASVDYFYRAKEVFSNTFIDSFEVIPPLQMFAQTQIRETIPKIVPIPLSLQTNKDSAIIRVKYYYKLGGQITDFDTLNNVLIQDQNFFNYFAYDDGTAEKVNGLFGKGMKLAYKFKLNVSDTLRAVQINFTPFNVDVQNKLLLIKVWRSIQEGSTSENVLFTSTNVQPYYLDSLNGLVTYKIEPPLILPQGIFYVGYEQVYEDLLQVGFDMNNSSRENTFFTDQSNHDIWTKSRFDGALMIRPLFGKELAMKWQNYTVQPVSVKKEKINDLAVYPNPAGDVISLVVPVSNKKYQILIYNYLGKLILQQDWNYQSVDVSVLFPGIYMLKAIDKENKNSVITKFVKF